LGKPRKDQPLNQPHYKGGQEALKAFIKSNLSYPEEAKKEGVEGVVEAAYDVDDRGIVKNIRILESLGYGCDEEVIRLINLLKYERAYNKGRNVTLYRKLKVDFKLPKEPQASKQQIHYHLVNGQQKVEQPKTKKTTITYTVTFGSKGQA